MNSSTKNTIEEVANVATMVIVSTSIFSFSTNLFLQTGLNKLLAMVKNLQIIVHILLIQVYLVAHAEAFLESLNKIISFQIYDLSDILEQKFDLKKD